MWKLLTLLDTSFSASEIDEDNGEPQSGNVTTEETRNSLEAGTGNHLPNYGDLSGHDTDVELEVHGSAGPSEALRLVTKVLADPGGNGNNSDVELEANEMDGTMTVMWSQS